VDLSDISGFAELPDGKVLSGTEQGYLLLWEGNLIKSMLTLAEGEPCHAGSIDVVLLKENQFMTLGYDGFVKWWDF
jgi:hypothetical protein